MRSEGSRFTSARPQPSLQPATTVCAIAVRLSRGCSWSGIKSVSRGLAPPQLCVCRGGVCVSDLWRRSYHGVHTIRKLVHSLSLWDTFWCPFFPENLAWDVLPSWWTWQFPKKHGLMEVLDICNTVLGSTLVRYSKHQKKRSKRCSAKEGYEDPMRSMPHTEVFTIPIPLLWGLDAVSKGFQSRFCVLKLRCAED